MKKKEVEQLQLSEFDWDDARTETLHSFALEFAKNTNPAYVDVGVALARAYLALPTGIQDLDSSVE